MQAILIFIMLFVVNISALSSKRFSGVLSNWSQTNNLIAQNARIKNLIVNGSVLGPDGSSNFGSSSSGNVNTIGSTTTNASARFADTTGTLLKNSSVLIDDSGNITINGITKNSNTVSWPSSIGAAGTFLGSDGVGNLVYASPSGGGNVSTAISFSNNNAILTTDTPSSVTNIQQTGVTLDTSNNMSGVNSLTANVVNSNLNGNAATATTALNFSGTLSGDVGGTQNATVVSSVGGQSATNIADATIAANAATNTNTPNTIVERDASGNFIASTITANLTGNVTGNLSGNATTATNATNAVNFTGPLVGDVSGTQGATVVSMVGGQTASAVANATTLANASTSSNTPSTIVRRDGSGNFSAGTITANLSGNATTATAATNFSGSLSGDVIGTQNVTVVNTVGGLSASQVASGASAANAATSVDTPSTIVARDGSGNFSANIITANLNGNATSATTAINTEFAYTATNFSGSLSGDVIGTQNATVVNMVGGQSATNIAAATIAANAATNTNTPNTIVERDASGNFIASTITANLTGNVTGNLSGNATTATNATNAVNFTGPLVGDVSGTQGATVVSMVGGQTASAVANATTLANASTSSNTPSTIVRRDGSGNFSAGTITASLIGNVTGNITGTATAATTAINFSGSLSGDVIGTQNATVVNTVGGLSASQVASGASAANAATSVDTPSTIVARDVSGDFSAGLITANLSGNATISNYCNKYRVCIHCNKFFWITFR